MYRIIDFRMKKCPLSRGIIRQEPWKMKTYSPKASELTRKWYVVDAKDKVLGRLASEIALRLRGKHKAEFAQLPDRKSVV